MSAGSAVAVAHPSLALVKYWGKRDGGVNIPATSSVAVTLGALTTRTTVRLGPAASPDRIVLDGREQPAERYRPFFDAVREAIGDSPSFIAESTNDFPTAAGLASSASGFAALATACLAAAGVPIDRARSSRLARIGSGSAARAVYPGFTVWRAGAESAAPLAGADHWSAFRVIVVPVATGPKAVSSRDAMNATRATSPYYRAWVDSHEELAERSIAAIAERDLEALGPVMRLSYARMFGSMLGADPPIRYWRPETLAVLDAVDALRREGVAAWETMDAGPQVKVVTTTDDVATVVARLRPLAAMEPIVSAVGDGATIVEPA